MKKVLICGAAMAMAFGASSAFAQMNDIKGYVGANYLAATYEEDGITEEFDINGISLKAGAQVNPYVAAEVRYGFGLGDDTISSGGSSLSVELDYLIGAYGVFGIPNASPLYPYAVLGFTKGELTAPASGPGGSASASASETDISYGLGANLSITDELGVNAEYMMYVDKEGSEVSGFSVGGIFRF